MKPWAFIDNTIEPQRSLASGQPASFTDQSVPHCVCAGSPCLSMHLGIKSELVNAKVKGEYI